MMKSFSAIVSLAIASSASARTFTVYNGCPFTIWPAMFTDLNVAPNVPNFPTGWEAAAFTAVSFTVPDNWKAGRIWGRRNCDFSTNPGPNSCATGGCNGGLLCDPHTGTGVPPATVAEFTLQGDGNLDFYDVSLVDGYDLPMRITNNVGCHVADCPVDLGPNCPSALKGPFDSTGFPLGCKSACDANLDGDPTNSANCCSGSHNTPATCPSSGVEFYSYFKSNCPNSYAYAFDESSGTALWTCDSGLNADYTVTFCPNSTTVDSGSMSISASGFTGSVASVALPTPIADNSASQSSNTSPGSSTSATSSTTSSTTVPPSQSVTTSGTSRRRKKDTLLVALLSGSVIWAHVVGII